MKIPAHVLSKFEKSAENEKFAKVTLECLIHDGYAKYRITKETSFVPDKPASGTIVRRRVPK